MVNDVQKLREATGAGVMECKRALDDAKGDLTHAERLITERGLQKAAKKEMRTTGAGLVITYVHQDRIGTMLQLHAETDFVVRAQPFRDLARELAMHITAMNPDSVTAFLTQPYVKDPSVSVADVIKRVVAQVGENIKVERFCRYEL